MGRLYSLNPLEGRPQHRHIRQRPVVAALAAIDYILAHVGCLLLNHCP